MAYYIHSVACSEHLTKDFKEIVPAPEMRRRMSRVLRMGVCTGMEALAALPEGMQVGAIITATRLGCLTDSERFLRNVVEGDQALLNPTPFIQSTFNTVGAQIALLTHNHCYNMTYVHGEASFESALTDAAIRIDQAGTQQVLVGLFDENTATLERIKERLGGGRDAQSGQGGLNVQGGQGGLKDQDGQDAEDGPGAQEDRSALRAQDIRGVRDLPTRDGAIFFVISARALPGSLGPIERLDEQNLRKWLVR